MNPSMARLLAAPVCLALVACSGGSGGSEPPPIQISNDLLSTGHVVLTQADEIEVAHPLKIQVQLTALESTSDVPVGFSLLLKADVDANKDEIIQFSMGTGVIVSLPAGKSTQIVELRIPEELTPAGDYYLICHVDPQEAIPETNEDNNLPSSDAVRDVTVAVREDKRTIPDMVLESVVPDSQLVPLDPLDDGGYPERNGIKDQKNHHCGFTALVSTTGAKILTNVEIQAFIEIAPKELLLLSIWEGDETQAKGYLETLIIAELDPQEPESLEVCVRIPESVRTRIIKLLGSSQFLTRPIHIVVDPKDKIVEFEESVQLANRPDDNRIKFDAIFTRPGIKAGPGYVDYRKNYEKTWSKSSFGVGISHKTRLHIEKKAYDAEIESSIPITIFGKSFDFLRVEGEGRGVAQVGKPIEPDKIPVDYRLEFAGTTLYRPGYNELKAKGTLDFWVQKDFPVDAQGKKGFRKTIIVYGVPIQVMAWATGRLGVKATLKTSFVEDATKLTSTLGLEVGPYASISVSATGTAKLPFVQPGVGTSLTLLAEHLIAHSGGTLIVTKTTKPKITMDLDYGLTNEVHGPTGKFWVFVKYRAYKWFMKRRWKTVSYTFLRWKTFVKRDVLINKKERLEFQL